MRTVMASGAPKNQLPPTDEPTLIPGFPFVRLPSFDVHLQTFDGPLDLLLQLLREGDLSITQLALVRVTDQYLAHVHALRELDLETIAGFLAIAAHLLVLKSRAIVHDQQVVQSDDVEEETEDELVGRLRLYASARQAAAVLAARQDGDEQAFSRSTVPGLPLPRPSGVQPALLATAMAAMLANRLPSAATKEQAAVPRPSLDRRIEVIRQHLLRQDRVVFADLPATNDGPAELVVTFLAVLNLWDAGEIVVQQETLFGDIWLSRPQM